MEEHKTEKDILTIEEAAALLQMGKRSVYKLIKEEKIPHRKVLNKYRFDRQSLIRWVAEKDDRKEKSTKRSSRGTKGRETR